MSSVYPATGSSRDHFPHADLNEAGRAADAAREVNGAVVACVIIRSFLDRSRRTPKGAPVEPFRVSTQHLVVELFCCRGLSGEFLKIKYVLPGLSDDPWAVVIILHILVAGDDNMWLERLHLVQC